MVLWAYRVSKVPQGSGCWSRGAVCSLEDWGLGLEVEVVVEVSCELKTF